MGSQTVLVVEDDALIAQSVASRLRSEGYETLVVHDGLEALSQAAQTPPDLVVLDLMLPGLDGLEVCRRLQADRHVPVLMLTAKSDEVDMLVGLHVGADDYMTKPFSPRELVARVQSILRRAAAMPVAASSSAGEGVLQVGSITIDVPRHRVLDAAGEEAHLTATEFDILRVLGEQPGVVHSRERIVQQVWGYSDDAAARTVDSHVRAIRGKLGEEVVRTVRGVGYAAAEAQPER